MKRKPFEPVASIKTIARRTCALVVVAAASWQIHAQNAKTPYSAMAPLDQYLMEPAVEMALARTAAPPSISQDAEVMIIGRHGYETAIKGKNGFVCIVQRSWTAGIDDPEFWNPKLRAPICFNPPAVRSYLPQTIRKTTSVLAGRSKTQMFADIEAGLSARELPPMEPGAMCYMLSKLGYLGDKVGHWHPHLMFLLPLAEPATWGAGLPGSPVALGSKDTQGRLTVFLVPVVRWSDGTVAEVAEH
jgi:hypothetical protein